MPLTTLGRILERHPVDDLQSGDTPGCFGNAPLTVEDEVLHGE